MHCCVSPNQSQVETTRHTKSELLCRSCVLSKTDVMLTWGKYTADEMHSLQDYSTWKKKRLDQIINLFNVSERVSVGQCSDAFCGVYVSKKMGMMCKNSAGEHTSHGGLWKRKEMQINSVTSGTHEWAHHTNPDRELCSCVSSAGNFMFWGCLCGKSPLHKVCDTLQQAGISPQQLLVR